MSFLDKLGETLQDAGWFVGAPVGAAIDLAKAAIPGGGNDGWKGALNAVTTGFDRGTQLFFGDQTGPDAGTQNAISPAINKGMDALEWVYDNAIAQPLNFANIEEQRVIANLTGTEDNASVLDFGSAWDRADEKTGGYAGKGTSIGRESAYTWDALLGGVFGKTSSLTNEGQQQLDEHSKLFDVQSGVGDAAARLFLDPTVVGGKITKVLRVSKYVAGLGKATEVGTKLADQGAGLFRDGDLYAGFGKRHDEAMKWAIQPNRTAGELVAAFPGLKESSDGYSVASILEQTNKTMRAAGKSDDQILEQAKLITRASLGDAGALKEIDDSAAFAKDALAAMQSNKDDLKDAAEWATQYSDRVTPEEIADAAHHLDLAKDLSLRGRDFFTSDNFVRLTNERLKSVNKDITAAEQEAARQERVRNMFLGTKSAEGDTVSVAKAGVLSDQPMLASALTASTKRLERAAKRERGEQAGMDFIFQSTLWNKGVKYAAPHIYLGQKAFGGFRKMAQPHEISVEDDRAPLQLDTFLKHSALDADTRLNLVSKLAAATSKGEKGRIIDQATQMATESIVKKFREDNPHFTDETEKMVNIALQKEMAKTGARNAAHTQMFSAHKLDQAAGDVPAGSRGDLFIDDDGLATFAPLLPTQLTSIYKLPDLKRTEHVLRRHSNWITDVAEWAKGNRAPDPNRVNEIASRVFDSKAEKFPGLDVRTSNRAQMVNDFVWKSEENAKLLLDGFNHHWKALTLASRPLAYGMRVNTESALRMISTLGPAAWMMHAAPRTFGFATLGTASGARAWFKSHADSLREEELRKGMETLADAHAGQTGEKLVAGVDPEYDAMKAEHDAITARLNLYRTGGRKGRREAYGVFGEAGHKSIMTRAGEIEGAFDTQQGRTNRWIISSETSAALLGDSSKLAAKSSQLTNWGYVPNTDIANHMPSWLHAVNAQLLQSNVGKVAVQAMVKHNGDMDAAARDVARWATGTPEGRKLMGEMQWTAHNKAEHARRITGYVDHYLPSMDLQKAAAKNGRVDQKELEAALPNIEDRPPVHGESLAIDISRGSLLGERINGVYSKILRWASDASEDQLARHPMYAAVYEQEVKRRAEFLLADPRIEKLTGGDIKRLVQDQAHMKARAAIKNYMYDIADTSDLSHFMRFVSPFVKAWEDTVRKWGRIIKEDPSVLARANLVWNAPNDMGIVVDQDGNPVASDSFFGYRDPKTGKMKATYLLIPSGLTKWIPGAGDSQLKISKQSFNLVLQGGLQPGFGPIVSYPTSLIQTAAPQLNDVAKIVNPYGPQSLFDTVAPSTVRELRNAIDSQSRDHMQDTRRIYAQMLAEYKLDPQKFGGKQPTINDAADRARSLGILKVLNRVNAPFPAMFQSPYQLYIDSYHALKERERSEGHPYGWADDEFVRQHGDTFFPLVQSQSRNNAGVGPTAEAVDAYNHYKPLINKYGLENGQANPDLIRLIIGQEGEGAYNDSAHRWQETREISPASGVKFRDYANPQAAQADADAKLGWLKYRQFMNNLDAMALEQGLRTYQDSPDLVQTRKEFIQNLQAENDAWHVEWSQRDNDKFERNLKALGEIANSDKFGPMRTDMQGVKQYLALRQALKEELASYGISEGSQDAQPFKQEFTQAIQDLVSQNSQFAEWSYYTFLERDPLLEPVQSAQSQVAPTDWGFGS